MSDLGVQGTPGLIYRSADHALHVVQSASDPAKLRSIVAVAAPLEGPGFLPWCAGAARIVLLKLEGTASWTLDLWGQVRRLIEENAATAQADQATLANATLCEQTLLATTLIELRLADAGIDLQQKTVEAYRGALRVTDA
jgi:hypothetical protein